MIKIRSKEEFDKFLKDNNLIKININKVLTKEEFKKRWESDDDGGGITYNDIAECAKEWGLYKTPRCCHIDRVTYHVLVAANVNDAASFEPSENDDYGM